MSTKKNTLAIGSAVAAALGVASFASASESPFSSRSLDNGGYMVAYADRVDPSKYGSGTKSAEGRCGQEFLTYHERIFDQIDANKDGAVDQPEADSFAKAQAPASPAAPAAPGAAPHAGMKK